VIDSHAVFSGSSLVLATLLTGSLARAAAGGHLVYSAPESCATETEFEGSVAERGGHFDAPSVGSASSSDVRELRVSIVRDAGGFHGSFQIVEAADASSTREVHGATCQEVVAALSVVSAIALRGDDRPAEASSSPSATSTSGSTPTPSETATADEGRFRASSSAGSRKVETRAGTVRFDQARSISVFAGGELGVLRSTVLPRYDLSVSAASFVTLPDGKNYLAGVIPRIRLSYLGQATYHANDASVSAQGVAAGIGLCWSPIYDTRGFVALLCAEYALGVMQLKSMDAQGKQTQTKSPALQSAGLGLETEYNLGPLFHVGLKAGLDAVLQPISADRLDGSEIFHSSTIAGYGMLGLGVHF
jgi:hypothetical protein